MNEPHSLDTLVVRIRRRWRVREGLHALGWALAAAALSGVFVALGVGMGGWALGAVALALLSRGVWKVIHPPSIARLLLRAEEAHPELEHLLSTLHAAPNTGPEFRAALETRGARAALDVKVERVVPLRPGRPWGAAAGALTLLALFTWLGPLAPGPVAGPAAAPTAPSQLLQGELVGDDVRLQTLDEIRVEVTPPAYTGQEGWSEQVEGEVTVLPGSRIRFTGGNPGEGAELRAYRVRGGTEPAALSPHPDASSQWSVEWTVTPDDRGLSMELLGEGDVLGHRIIPLSLLSDPAPEVELLTPSQDVILATGSGQLQIRARARDAFGLASFHLAWIHTRGSGESFDFREGRGEWSDLRSGPDGVEGSLTLKLDALELGPGDVLHLRAVARDRNGVTGPGEGVSRTRQLRVIREGEEMSVTALTGFPLEAERNPILSQRMILLMTEALVERLPTLSAQEVAGEAAEIAHEQARLRAETAEQVYSRATGAMRTGDDHDHAGHDRVPIAIVHPSRGEELTRIGAVTIGGAGEMPVGAGTLPEQGHDHDGDPILSVNRPLLRIHDLMWLAESALLLADPRRSIPYQEAALAGIQELREGQRLFPRGLVLAPPIDVDGTRGTGSVDDARPAPRQAGEPLSSLAPQVAELDRLAGQMGNPELPRRLSDTALRFLSDPRVPAEAATLLARASDAARGGEPDETGRLLARARDALGEGARWVTGRPAPLPHGNGGGTASALDPSPMEEPFVFATLRYESGNWDSAPLVPTNLIHSLARYTDLPVAPEGVLVELGSPELFRYPFVYLTGHLPVRFSQVEAENLRQYVDGGGFLFMDDHNHDIDGAFHRTATAELARIFGDDALQPLPKEHELFHTFFRYEDGPPVTAHELSGWGDGLIHPELFAIERQGRIAVLYSNKDYSSEWNYHAVNKRFLAVDNTRIGVNFILYALTR